MWWWHNDWGWGVWFAMTVGMLLFWGAVIWLVVFLARTANEPPATRDPERILAERFAAGAISSDEYQERLAVLRGSGSDHPPKVSAP